MAFTRRSHIVRVSGPDSAAGPLGQKPYIDFEVLDAIAYRTTNGKEMILNCPAAKAAPLIVDNTKDDGNGKNNNAKGSGEGATRTSHMVRVQKESSPPSPPKPPHVGECYFDIECLDRMAFRDDRGKEWILDYPRDKSEPTTYNVDVDDKPTHPTRRTHFESLVGYGPPGGTGGSDPGAKPKKLSGQTMTIERTDMVAFRTIMGDEVIIKMESHDDGTFKNSSRADTVVWSPAGYDPATGLPEPPSAQDAGDNNVYGAFITTSVTVPPVLGFTDGWVGTVVIANSPTHEVLLLTLVTDETDALALAELTVEASSGFFIDPGVAHVHLGPFVISPGSTGDVTGTLDTGKKPASEDSVAKVDCGPLWWPVRWFTGG